MIEFCETFGPILSFRKAISSLIEFLFMDSGSETSDGLDRSSEDVLLRTLNKQVQHFTGTGKIFIFFYLNSDVH